MIRTMIKQAFRDIAQKLVTLVVLFFIVFVIAGGLAGCLVWELSRTGQIGPGSRQLQRPAPEMPKLQIPDAPTAREVFEKYGIENWGLPE